MITIPIIHCKNVYVDTPEVLEPVAIGLDHIIAPAARPTYYAYTKVIRSRVCFDPKNLEFLLEFYPDLADDGYGNYISDKTHGNMLTYSGVKTVVKLDGSSYNYTTLSIEDIRNFIEND